MKKFGTGKMSEYEDSSSNAMNAIREEMRLMRQTMAEMSATIRDLRENQTQSGNRPMKDEVKRYRVLGVSNYYS